MNRHCRHYRGMAGTSKCEAGVAFASLEHFGTRRFLAWLPCLGLDQSGRCDKREHLTDEQLKGSREMEARFIGYGDWHEYGNCGWETAARRHATACGVGGEVEVRNRNGDTRTYSVTVQAYVVTCQPIGE